MWLVTLTPVLAKLNPRERFEALGHSEVSPAGWWLVGLVILGVGLVAAFLLWGWWRQRCRSGIPPDRLRAFRAGCLDCGLTRSETDSLWGPAYAVRPARPADILSDRRLFQIAVAEASGNRDDAGELTGNYARIAEKIGFPQVARAPGSEVADIVAKAAAKETGQAWEFNARIIEIMENSMRLTHHGIAKESDALEDATELRCGDVWYVALPTDYADAGEVKLAFNRADITDVFRQKLRLRSSDVPAGRGPILLRVGLGAERDPLWVVGHVRGD